MQQILSKYRAPGGCTVFLYARIDPSDSYCFLKVPDLATLGMWLQGSVHVAGT